MFLLALFFVCIRVLICLLFIKSLFALFIFGIVNLIDFYSRSIIYRIGLSKIYNSNIKINKREDIKVNT